jgi:hypothetical protein
VQRSCVQLRPKRKSFKVPRPQVLWHTCKGRDENRVRVCRVSMPRGSCFVENLSKSVSHVCILLFVPGLPCCCRQFITNAVVVILGSSHDPAKAERLVARSLHELERHLGCIPTLLSMQAPEDCWPVASRDQVICSVAEPGLRYRLDRPVRM